VVPKSGRRRTLALGACLLVAVAAAASVAIASSSKHRPHTRALVVACAQKRDGLLRYVPTKSACIPARERAVEFACRIAGRDLTSTEWQTYLGSQPRFQVCPS